MSLPRSVRSLFAHALQTPLTRLGSRYRRRAARTASLSWTERLAATGVRHPRLMILVWSAILLAGIGFASRVGQVLTMDSSADGLEASRTEQLAREHLPETQRSKELVVIQSPVLSVDDPPFRSFAKEVIARLHDDGVVAQVLSYYEVGETSLVSADRHTLLIPVTFADGTDRGLSQLIAEVQSFDGLAGFTVVTSGSGSIERSFAETARSDLQLAELIGIPVAIVILIVVFGALAAAGLPVALGIGSIIVSIGVAAIIGQVVELSTFVLNMIAMIGMAVGVDYSLLIVQRYREERREGLERNAAIERTGATAGRAVLFSGITVIVALSGLLIIPDTTFRSLALGAIVVVLVSVAAALTLLPALLRVLGDRVNAGRIRLPGWRPARPLAGLFWAGTAKLVMRRPALSIGLGVALLAAAAVPYFQMRLGSAGVDSLPAGTDAHRAAAILADSFSQGPQGSAEIVIQAYADDAASVSTGVAQLQALLARDAAFGPASVDEQPGGLRALVTVQVNGAPEGALASAAITRLRDQYLPLIFNGTGAEALVGGHTAWMLDYDALLTEFTPIVYAFVLGLSLLVLLVVFRSVVVPVKAILLNLLSVSAACGLIVLVFQMGVGSFLGITRTAPIEPWVPLFLFAILFGLSMDYHIFLLTRIREHFDLHSDNEGAVVHGLRTTAGMITGAALIMVAVFVGFATGELVVFQQMGFGLAVAIFLDATIVRIVLVPASMALLGRWNWYLPSWLNWLPQLNVEGPLRPAPAPPA